MEGFVPGRRKQARIERVYEPGPSGTVRPIEHRVFSSDEKEKDFVSISNDELAALGLDENSDYSHSTRSGREKVLEVAYRKREGISDVLPVESTSIAALSSNQDKSIPPSTPYRTFWQRAREAETAERAYHVGAYRGTRFAYGLGLGGVALFVAPFALLFGTTAGMWWLTGKIPWFAKKGGGGHEKKEKKHEKKDNHDHSGGDHGKKDH